MESDSSSQQTDVQLPQYYREGFFSHDTLFHPELPGGRMGVAGTPIPYTVHGDSFITSMLLACFLIAVYAIASSRRFISIQTKELLYGRRSGTTEISETAGELRLQFALVLITCIQLSVLYYFYTIRYVGQMFVLQSNYYLIAIYLGLAIAYFLLKSAAYTAVSLTFFDGKRNLQWMKSFLFITSLEGVLVFPAVMASAYLNLPLDNVLIYVAIVFAIVKLLTIYKTFLIFFKVNVVKLQIILYFCTLEIIPLLLLLGALSMVTESLKINF
ncbi:MAG: DUF4271 domain-containing protein [Prevotella sp.]|nr:DUF4271 domain-containing protein [Prevotella sp.]